MKIERQAAREPRRRWLALGIAVVGLACGSGLTEPDVITLFVAPQEVECFTLFPTTCLQVRENPDDEWQNFSGEIEGFEFAPGFLYELRVERHRIENPPADGSSLRYVLLEVVSKQPA